jgi:hypothetical protein
MCMIQAWCFIKKIMARINVHVESYDKLWEM